MARTLTAVERLADLVREAGSVVALTGAGISVPSGIPDFRSPGTGLWEDVDPMEVAHIDAWRADPERFWRFYGDRFAALQDKRPNGAHARARRARAPRAPRRRRDPEHRPPAPAGGDDAARRGPRDDRPQLVPGLRARVPLDAVRARLAAAPDGVPRCACAAPLKPDVVLFGEFLPQEALQEAYALAAAADVLLCVGTSLEVQPVAQLPGVTGPTAARSRSSRRARRPGTGGRPCGSTATSWPSCAPWSTRWPPRRSVCAMGRVVHFEVHAEDLDRAERFYRDVLGWSVTRVEGVPVDYRLVHTGEGQPGIDGAITARRGAIDGQAVIAWVCTAQVDDVEDTVRRAVEAGGEVALGPDDIPGVGRLAYLKDTEGNVFGVLQPAPASPGP